MDELPVSAHSLLRWSEALSGIARTGLGFTQSLYERERFEEILKVAADMRVAAGHELETEVLVEEWLKMVGEGVAGYVTPKVAVGAVVGNDDGEILLIQRADTGVWLYPTGWADIGYSASEVAVKEVVEETGIEAEPLRIIAVLDGLRLGFTTVPLYSLVFHCRATGGDPGRPSAGDARRRLVRRGRPARPRWPGPTAGRRPPSRPSGASRSTCCSTGPATRRGAANEPRRVLPGGQLGQQAGDDRRGAPGPLPLVAQRRVVDQAAGVGWDAERRRHRGRQRHRLALLAIGGKRLEALPQLVERGGRLLAGGKGEGHARRRSRRYRRRPAGGTRRPDGGATRG